MAILSVRYLWRARTRGGFPYSVEHMAGGDHVQVNRLKPRAPIFAYMEHAQFVKVSCRSNYCGVFMRDSERTCSLSFSLHSSGVSSMELRVLEHPPQLWHNSQLSTSAQILSMIIDNWQLLPTINLLASKIHS